MWNIYVPAARRSQKVGSDSLKLELQMDIDNHMDTGTSVTNPVTYKRIQGSQLLIDLSSPFCTVLFVIILCFS